MNAMEKQGQKINKISGGLIEVWAGGQNFVISAVCSHRQGLLVYGYVNDRTRRITCPLHHSTFDLSTGCPLSGPAREQLRVEENGGQVS